MERWAIYNAKDHLFIKSLITDLILYDKIVFPVPVDDVYDEWMKLNWQPNVQEKIIDILRKHELCKCELWTVELQKKHKVNINRHGIGGQIITKDWESQRLRKTKLALENEVNEKNKKKDPKNTLEKPHLIHAYHSSDDISNKVLLAEKLDEEPLSDFILKMGCLIQHDIFIPDYDFTKDYFTVEHIGILKDIAQYVKDEEFIQKRQNFYKKQNEMYKSNGVAEFAFEELVEALNELNKLTSKWHHKTLVQSVLTVGTLTEQLLKPYSLVSLTTIACQTALFISNRQQDDKITNHPFAIFHDLKARKGIDILKNHKRT